MVYIWRNGPFLASFQFSDHFRARHPYLIRELFSFLQESIYLYIKEENECDQTGLSQKRNDKKLRWRFSRALSHQNYRLFLFPKYCTIEAVINQVSGWIPFGFHKDMSHVNSLRNPANLYPRAHRAGNKPKVKNIKGSKIYIKKIWEI